MKLEFPKIKIETSQAFESENFSLGDMRVIMTLLSDKIYSRPKYIIVQEVASNARDANREAKRPDTPIQIKLPSRLDDNIIIADSGPGISPARMSDVFLKYGESTKRGDNVLTGGFGIGAKTPFTYTDTFNVVTVTDDDDGKRRQRTYIAHKADNGFARMSLVDTRDSTEETGTAISFAVERADFRDFEIAVREVCRYWKVRPIISGTTNWTWPEEKELHSGKGWALVSNRNQAKVLIDGIPYSLRLDTIFGDDRSNEAYRVITQGSIRMYFNVGELDVSATREDLDYKDRTIKAIKARADVCLNDLRAKVSKAVDSSKTLWEASIKWHNDSSAFRQFLVEPQWKGKKLFSESYSGTGSLHTKGLKGYKGGENYIYIQDQLKITNFIQQDGSIVSKKSYGRSVDRYLRVHENAFIVEDDEGKARPNRLRMQTIFAQNPGITTITIVLFKTDVGRLYAEQKMGWNDMPTHKLSSFAKAKKPKGPNGKTRTINAVKTLKHSTARNGWTKQWIPCPDRAPEDGKGGTYVILKDGKPILSNGTKPSKDTVERIFKILDPQAPIYGILYKYRNKIDDSWTDLLTEAKKRVTVLRAKPKVDTYIKYGHAESNGNLGSSIARIIKNNTGTIEDKSIEKYLETAKLANGATGDYNAYKSLADYLGEKVDAPGSDFEKLKKKLFDAYPLLTRFERIINTYAYQRSAEEKQNKLLTKELIFYLNAKFKAAKAAAKESK